MPVPLLDLSRQYEYLKPELDEAVVRVLTHGKFILGPEVAELEKKVASLCEVDYAIGVARPLSLAIETFGTGKVPDEMIHELIEKHFDFRPAKIIHELDLRRPIYRPTAAYGHFGRDDIEAPWERTDKAELLRADAGL